ncbi:MAG TPA: BlaI/MecI/CopY family transcriptional regulator [Planctomycetaceae bacterium]|nr:BlaI/MecI/CopY family transcriptional regulator [Planctomycetaceae bacterium]
MPRPAARELTERELEVMHVFWTHGEMTAADARDHLAELGLDRAYVTVANLVRILLEKGCLRQVSDERPYRYVPQRSFDEVSRRFVRDLLDRVFRGSREDLLVKVLGEKRLSAAERELLEQILKEQK